MKRLGWMGFFAIFVLVSFSTFAWAVDMESVSGHAIQFVSAGGDFIDVRTYKVNATVVKGEQSNPFSQDFWVWNRDASLINQKGSFGGSFMDGSYGTTHTFHPILDGSGRRYELMVKYKVDGQIDFSKTVLGLVPETYGQNRTYDVRFLMGYEIPNDPTSNPIYEDSKMDAISVCFYSEGRPNEKTEICEYFSIKSSSELNAIAEKDLSLVEAVWNELFRPGASMYELPVLAFPQNPPVKGFMLVDGYEGAAKVDGKDVSFGFYNLAVDQIPLIVMKIDNEWSLVISIYSNPSLGGYPAYGYADLGEVLKQKYELLLVPDNSGKVDFSKSQVELMVKGVDRYAFGCLEDPIDGTAVIECTKEAFLKDPHACDNNWEVASRIHFDCPETQFMPNGKVLVEVPEAVQKYVRELLERAVSGKIRSESFDPSNNFIGGGVSSPTSPGAAPDVSPAPGVAIDVVLPPKKDPEPIPSSISGAEKDISVLPVNPSIRALIPIPSSWNPSEDNVENSPNNNQPSIEVVSRSSESTRLRIQGVEVVSSISSIVVNESGLFVNGKLVNAVPKELTESKPNESIQKVELGQKNNQNVFLFTIQKDAKFLGIIPIKLEIKKEVSVENKILKEEKPWWSFLVFG